MLAAECCMLAAECVAERVAECAAGDVRAVGDSSRVGLRHFLCLTDVQGVLRPPPASC